MLCAFELGSIKVFYHTKILICITYFLLTSLYVFRIFSFRLCNDTFTYSFDSLLDFNYKFESIHPFKDGNGRIGRLLLFKECLKYNIVPFIIDDELKLFYYRGLKEWAIERGYLRDTCLMAQDKFKLQLDYFKIKY